MWGLTMGLFHLRYLTGNRLNPSHTTNRLQSGSLRRATSTDDKYTDQNPIHVKAVCIAHQLVDVLVNILNLDFFLKKCYLRKRSKTKFRLKAVCFSFSNF